MACFMAAERWIGVPPWPRYAARFRASVALLVKQTGYGESIIPDSSDLASALSREDAAVAAFVPEWLPFNHPAVDPVFERNHRPAQGHRSRTRGHHRFSSAHTISTCDLAFGERFHWYSATGWVMWNMQVGGLLAGTTICLFDGAPGGAKARPDFGTLWAFAARHRVTWFGAGAAFFNSCRKAGVHIGDCGDLSAVRALGSTGSPLPPDVQRWGTDQFAALGRREIWWCNLSGGTELAAAFLSGNRELPATPGRLQCRHLGAQWKSGTSEKKAIRN